MFCFDRQSSDTTGPKGYSPDPKPKRSTHTARLFMLVTMVPKMQVLVRIGSRASLFAESYKNASWMRSFWLAIVVYVNIKQFSSLSTTGMTHVH